MATKFPRYRCHKEVSALKIRSISVRYAIDDSPSGALIFPENARFGAILVTQDFINKHAPKVGGYWVLYDDGYQSFSPALAFENGYTLIEEDDDNGD